MLSSLIAVLSPWLRNVGAAAALGVVAMAPAAAQQRNPLQTVGETVLDQPAQSYRFERFVIESGEPARRWRVNIGVPTRKASAPAPVLYMLDGNAAAMVFDQALLSDQIGRAHV